MSQRHDPVPGDLLLHPAMLLAMVLLLLNDHVLKAAIPGELTGKLSDVAGVIVLSGLLLSLTEVVRRSRRSVAWMHRADAWIACGITAIGLSVVKLTTAGDDAYSYAVGAARWSLGSAIAFLSGSPAPALVPIDVVRDPADLFTLAALLVTLTVARRRMTRACDVASTVGQQAPAGASTSATLSRRAGRSG